MSSYILFCQCVQLKSTSVINYNCKTKLRFVSMFWFSCNSIRINVIVLCYVCVVCTVWMLHYLDYTPMPWPILWLGKKYSDGNVWWQKKKSTLYLHKEKQPIEFSIIWNNSNLYPPPPGTNLVHFVRFQFHQMVSMS